MENTATHYIHDGHQIIQRWGSSVSTGESTSIGCENFCIGGRIAVGKWKRNPVLPCYCVAPMVDEIETPLG